MNYFQVVHVFVRIALLGAQFRAGFVTAAAQAGASTWSNQRQTEHRSEITVHRYTRGISPFKMNASQTALRF
ncbi:hypothetical protein QN397_21910 [Variovorax sp. RTB1]|jgi:hypothetical protein|uniref:hypothetical protein n=1 Tax=Variovorax sp. RTB1 TaxID=3048631 RepID=UPI002B234D71|nr:hypothetical protein [Variovorax sp. RTB1]MEB0113957.1 hypothetical protein [Variovorax sp. RTB1]